MLILSRKDGEKIRIGTDIVIKVLDSNKGIVKLGIDAPDDVMILRDELFEEVENVNKQASHENSLEILSTLKAKLKK